MVKIKKIPERFRKWGFDYTQLGRVKQVAIFLKISKPGNMGYKVVIIRKKSITVMPNGVILPSREIFPNNEDFGTYGWYYQNKENAEKKFKELVEKVEK